ncbi:MAG: TolC family protein [Desulfobacterales bacterium]|nr:TolC family protein [Desulfobacterales bacterium]
MLNFLSICKNLLLFVSLMSLISPAYVLSEVNYKDSMSLMDAIRLSLEHNPNILLQKEDVAYKKGDLQAASGKFDINIGLNTQGEYIQEELKPEVYNAELKRRLDNEANADKAHIIAESLEERLRILDIEEERSREGKDFVSVYDIILDQEANTVNENEAEKLRTDSYDSTRKGIIASIEAQRQVETNSLIYLKKLGGVPTVDEKTYVSIDASGKKKFRNGLEFTQRLRLSESSNQYRGKNQDVPPTYNSEIWFEFKMPLGKGRGTDSTTAREKSSAIAYDASLLSLHQTTIDSLYSTVSAYWGLVAAQEKVKFYKRSFQFQARLLEISRHFVEADEIPKFQLGRIIASEASARASLYRANQELHHARLSLIKIIGLDIEDLKDTLTASNNFPLSPPANKVQNIKADNFIKEALEKRQDYQASVKFEEISKINLRATEIDALPQADLSFFIGCLGQDRDGNVGTGAYQSLFKDMVAPSIKLALDFNYPFANNQGKGSIIKAQSSFGKNRIYTEDLERQIKANIISAVDSLMHSIAELEKCIESATYFEKTMDSELQRFTIGKTTLVDSIFTEKQLTQSESEKVSSQMFYATNIIRLKYETASIINFSDGGFTINEKDFFELPKSR